MSVVLYVVGCGAVTVAAYAVGGEDLASVFGSVFLSIPVVLFFMGAFTKE